LSRLTSLIDIRRVAVAAVLLPFLAVGVYLLLPDSGTEAGVEPPSLLNTPPSNVTSEIGLEEGKLAPDFEITTTDGRRVRLSDFRGRPVVVNFHALWCTSCLVELPELQAIQEHRGLETFAVLAVNAGETKARALEFADFLDAPFTFGLDTNLTVSDAYGVRGLPASVFIDAEGVVQVVYFGYPGQELLNRFVDSAIDAQPPGEIPPVIRTVNTIPRDYLLSVERTDDLLVFRSRALRCDAGYCAELVLGEVLSYAGIAVTETAFTADMPSLTIRYDPAVITEEQVIDAVTDALSLLEDPVYTGELEVVVTDG
jgi:peroxiredoxin